MSIDSHDVSAAAVPVSVVVPCYRCADSLDRAVRSIADQSWRPAEVILVDDCSGDGTLDVAYRLKSEFPQGWIRIVALPVNSGPGAARNAGWDVCSQPYLAFLDADDSWHAQKIEIQYGWMARHPEAALTGHVCVLFDQREQDHRQFDKGEAFLPVSKRKLLLSNQFSTPSIMLRTNLEQRFPVEGYCEDYHLWTEILCSGFACFRAELPLAYLYKAGYGEAGLSAALWKMEKGELQVYRNLWHKDYIGSFGFAGLTAWSVLKFMIRWVRVTARKAATK